MGKIRVGNKQNSFLNGEHAGHVRKRTGAKHHTSRMRRVALQKDTDEHVKNISADEDIDTSLLRVIRDIDDDMC